MADATDIETTEKPTKGKRGASAAPDADAMLKARRARAEASGVAPGSVAGAEPGFRYTYIVTRDYPADGRQVAAIRKHLAERGYEPRTGPGASVASDEFVAGEPDAEIYRAPSPIADDEWKDEFLLSLKNPAWFENQRRRENHGIAKKALELATTFHKATGTERTAAERRLEEHVRNTPVLGLQVIY